MHYTSREVYEHVSKKMNDPIIERRTCAVSWTEFPIYSSDDAFYAKISPTFDGKKFPIPRPTLCPEERQRRRLLFRNERKLYKRKCDATWESIVSIYSPDKAYTVYHKDYWWSDNRDWTEYWVVFDATKSFLWQFKDFYAKVPRCSLSLMKNENTEYGNDVEQAKNCYMIFNCWDIEDSYYASAVGPQCRDVVDSYWVNYSDIVYEGVYLVRCHNVFFSSYCNDCSFCSYCVDCQSCQNCYDCHGLLNKQYCINNIQYTAETYQDALASYKIQDTQRGCKVDRIVRSQKVYGNNMIDSWECMFCYWMVGCHDCKYTTDGLNFDTASDTTNCGTESTHVYESIWTYFVTYSWFTIGCNGLSRSWYCIDCFSCNDCFWCIGLRNKSYCIFNKQYTKEDYEKEVAMIINTMQKTWERWVFFDPALSSFGYNETVADEYMPLDVASAKQKWYLWLDSNYDPAIPPTSKVIYGRDYDDAGREDLLNDDKICNCIFICEESGRPFRVIAQEVAFYKKHKLQIPTLHPDVRHLKRIEKRQNNNQSLFG